MLQIIYGPGYSAMKRNLDVLGVEGMLLGFMHLTSPLLQGLCLQEIPWGCQM